MRHPTEKEAHCLNRALGKSTELISNGGIMRTKKKARIAAEKWAEKRHFATPNTEKIAFIEGYTAQEETTPGPWDVNPGHQPDESVGNRIDILCLDKGVIEDVEADYQDWYARAVMDSIVEWRLHVKD